MISSRLAARIQSQLIKLYYGEIFIAKVSYPKTQLRDQRASYCKPTLCDQGRRKNDSVDVNNLQFITVVDLIPQLCTEFISVKVFIRDVAMAP